MEQESKGIRWQSENRRKVQNLMYLVNEGTLREEHRKQSEKKATGVDGVKKDDYDEKLDENLKEKLYVSRVMAWESEDACAIYYPD